MKKWNTTQQMANYIAEMDISSAREMNISKCNIVAKHIKNLYQQGGKQMVVVNIVKALPAFHPITNPKGLSICERYNVEKIVKTMLKWHWIPFSKISRNMKRVCK